MKRVLLVAGLGLLLACGEATTPPAPTPCGGEVCTQARVQLADTTADYIVLLEDAADPDQVAVHAGGQVRHLYRAAVRGFAMRLAPQAAAALANRADVRILVPDGPVSVADTQVVFGGLWGLDRIDQRTPAYDGRYVHDPLGGRGVHVYVLDTGIRTTHREFGGRAFGVFDGVGDGNGANDCHGHGTHVAATIAGQNFGVAKAATVYAVRVLNCGGSGTWSGVIAGVDWVVANGVRPALMSASLGGLENLAADDAVNRAVLAGIPVVVAAANANQDACLWSPAGASEAITVGATMTNDQRASFSNWGPCLDLFAPGVGTLSAWWTSDSAFMTLSGTSMATPHVSGTLAVFLSFGLTPADLLDRASRDVVLDPFGSPNVFVYAVPADSALPPPPPDTTPPPPPPPPPPPVDSEPVARFNASCPQGSCRFDARRSSDDSLIVRYDWEFGDGSAFSDTVSVAFHTYTAEQLYPVRLTVTDNHGQTGTFTRWIKVSKVRSLGNPLEEIFQ